MQVLLHRLTERRAIALATMGTLLALLATSRLGDHAADFLTYRYGVLAADTGLNVYTGNVTGPGLTGQPFTYTPFGAIALWPTTILTWQLAYLLWCALSMLALGMVLARFVPATIRHRPAVLVAVIAAAGTTCITAQNVAQGQINVLLMALCLGDLFRRDDSVLAARVPRGVLIGVATAIKLTPGLFLIYFAVTGQWRLARAGLIGTAAATALGAVVHPGMTVTFFRTALWSLPDRVDLGHPVGYWANNSVSGVFESLGGWAAVATPVFVVATAVLGLIAARQTVRAGRAADSWLIVGLTASLVSPFTWTHHLVYLLPALTTLALTRGWARRPAAIAGGVLVLAVLHFGLPGAVMRLVLIALCTLSIAALRCTVPMSGSDQGTSLRVWKGPVRTLAK